MSGSYVASLIEASTKEATDAKPRPLEDCIEDAVERTIGGFFSETAQKGAVDYLTFKAAPGTNRITLTRFHLRAADAVYVDGHRITLPYLLVRSNLVECISTALATTLDEDNDDPENPRAYPFLFLHHDSETHDVIFTFGISWSETQYESLVEQTTHNLNMIADALDDNNGTLDNGEPNFTFIRDYINLKLRAEYLARRAATDATRAEGWSDVDRRGRASEPRARGASRGGRGAARDGGAARGGGAARDTRPRIEASVRREDKATTSSAPRAPLRVGRAKLTALPDPATAEPVQPEPATAEP